MIFHADQRLVTDPQISFAAWVGTGYCYHRSQNFFSMSYHRSQNTRVPDSLKIITQREFALSFRLLENNKQNHNTAKNVIKILSYLITGATKICHKPYLRSLSNKKNQKLASKLKSEINANN